MVPTLAQYIGKPVYRVSRTIPYFSLVCFPCLHTQPFSGCECKWRKLSPFIFSILLHSLTLYLTKEAGTFSQLLPCEVVHFIFWYVTGCKRGNRLVGNCVLCRRVEYRRVSNRKRKRVYYGERSVLQQVSLVKWGEKLVVVVVVVVVVGGVGEVVKGWLGKEA